MVNFVIFNVHGIKIKRHDDVLLPMDDNSFVLLVKE